MRTITHCRPNHPISEIYQRPEIPVAVAEACDRLGWILIRAQRFAGHTSYLVQDDAGIIEPYTGSTLILLAVDRSLVR